MTVMHHQARRVAREAIGSPVTSEIADLVYFRVSGSKYSDEKGQFFLLPKIDHISEQTGYSNKVCAQSLKHLEKDGWIIRIRKRCYDHAVRTKIYISDKFAQLMEEIYEMFKHANPPLTRHQTNNDDHDDNGIAEIDHKVTSLIKDQKQKDHNSYNNLDNNDHAAITQPYQKDETVKSVINYFSYDLEENSEAYQFVKHLSESYSLDFNTLLMTLIDLQETNFYSQIEDLIEDAIISLKRIDKEDVGIPQAYSKVLPKKALFHAEDERSDVLSPLQQVALSQILSHLVATGKATVGSIKEVFSWIEFQLTNPLHHFQGKGFKHALNIVSKMLCNQGIRNYSKPFGYAK